MKMHPFVTVHLIVTVRYLHFLSCIADHPTFLTPYNIKKKFTRQLVSFIFLSHSVRLIEINENEQDIE